MRLKKLLKRLLLPSAWDDARRAMRYREGVLRRNPNSRLRRRICRFRYNRICRRYSCVIPISAKVPEDTIFPHGLNGVFISAGAELGSRCTIFHQVTIGSNTLQDSKGLGAPILGDEVYIGAGAKIIGNVRIGNRVRIGANAVVVTDVPDDATVVCAPCRILPHDAPRDNHFKNYASMRAKIEERRESEAQS